MTIDARSLMAVAAALLLLFGMIVLLLERRLSQPMAGLRLWSAANFALGIGAILHMLQGVSNGWLALLVGNALLLAGRAADLASLRQFDHRRVPARPILIACLALMAAVAVFTFVWPDFELRSATMVGGLAVLCGACVVSLALGRPFGVSRVVTMAGLAGQALANLWCLAAQEHPFDEPLALILDSPVSGTYVGTLLILDVLANVGFVLLITDRMHEWVLQLARTDHLTGALSRGALYAQAQRDLQRARRQGSYTAAFIVDIDNFKAVNDRYGHGHGDAVLRHVARQGQSVLRCSDLFGRYGGDEFVAVLPDTDLLTAAAIAERLRLAVADPEAALADELPPPTVSIGVAAVAAGAQGVDELVAQADAALFNAKNAGRNRTRVANDAQAPEKTSLHLLQGRR
jgi:diguanylate cyclase (GGDEF)-like protein